MINDKVLNMFSKELNKLAAFRNFAPAMYMRTKDKDNNKRNIMIASVMDDVVMAAMRGLKGV